MIEFIASTERIERLVRDCQCMKELYETKKKYEKMQMKVKETYSIKPEAVLSHIIEELDKDPTRRQFTEEERQFDLPKKVEDRIERKAYWQNVFRRL